MGIRDRIKSANALGKPSYWRRWAKDVNAALDQSGWTSTTTTTVTTTTSTTTTVTTTTTLMGQFISLSSNDGWVQALDKSTWQEARDAATGNDSTRSGQNRYATAFGGYKPWDYNMGRAFFDFVLNQAPGTVIVKAELHLYGYSNGGISACVCQGTQSASLDRPDYDAFTGLLFDSIVSWNASGWNIFDFNALGLAYINSIITGTAKICLREYDHDYLNVSTDALYLGGVYFAEDATFKPFLKLWKGES